MAVSERRFGLEIECGLNGDVDRAVNAVYQNTGIELEIDYDGSEFEFRTPVLQGDEGFAKLEGIYQGLLDNGGFVTRADGGHVHHEALDYVGNHAMLARLVRSWINLEPAIESCVVPYRRGTYGACPQYFKKGDGTVKKIRGGYFGRGALNIGNVRADRNDTPRPGDYCRYCDVEYPYCYCDEAPPTIEIRLLEGTLDIKVMRPWIEMTQRLLDKVSHEGLTIRSCQRVTTLKSRLDLPDETAEALREKAKLVNDNRRTNTYMSQFDRSRYGYDYF